MAGVQDVVYRLVVDASGANPTFEAIKKDAAGLGDIKPNVDFKNLNELQTELQRLKTVRDNALDFKTTQVANEEIAKVSAQIKNLGGDFSEAGHESSGFFANLKEGFAGIGQISIGTALGEEVKNVFSGFISKAHEASDAAHSIEIGLARAGVSMADIPNKAKQAVGFAKQIADDYALAVPDVEALEGKIAGFGGVSGDMLKQLTELSLGASKAWQIPADSVARLIAVAADPEAQATLSRYGITFERNATAAEKMAVIQKKLGATIEATKAATHDATGDFDRLKNEVEDAAVDFANNAFSGLEPVFQELMPTIKALGEDLAALGSTVGSIAVFIGEHKTLVLSLVGAYAAFRTIAAVNQLGGLGAVWTKANASVLEYLKNLVGKLIPGLGAQVAAEEAVTVAEGEAAAGAEATAAASTLALGPIGLLIAAAVAVGIGFALFSSSTKDLKDATKDANDALTDFNNTASKTQEIETQSSSIDAMANRYDELKGKTTLTAQEQAELNNITAELAKTVPDAIDKVDAYTGAVTIATSKVHDFTKEQNAVAASDKKDALSALKDSTADLANSYKAAADKVGELKQKQSVLEKGIPIPISFIDSMKQAVGIMGNASDKNKEVTHEIVQQRKEMDAARPQLQANIKALEQQGFTAAQIAKETGLTVDQVHKLEPAVQKANVALGDQQETVKQIADAFAQLKNLANGEDFNNTQAAALSAQVQLGTLERSLAEARKQHDTERIASLQNLIKQQQDQFNAEMQHTQDLWAVQAQISIAQAHSDAEHLIAQTELQEQVNRIKASAQDQIDITRHAGDIAATRNKIEQENFEIAHRQNAEHKLWQRDQVSLLQLQLKGLQSQESALTGQKKYTIGMHANLQLDSQITDLKKQELDLIQKIADAQKNIEFNKPFRDLQDSILKHQEAEISIGFRPKEDDLNIIQARIDRLKKDIGRDQLKLNVDFATGGILGVIDEQGLQLQKKIVDEDTSLLGLKQQYNDKQVALDKELRDAQIAAIDDPAQREREQLQARIQDFEAYYNERIAKTGQLTEREQALRAAGEQKFRNDAEALDKKNLDDREKLYEGYINSAIDELTKFITKQGQLSQAEFDSQRLQQDQQQAQLEDKYARGEISAREYQVQLAKLNEDRTNLENKQNESVASVLKKIEDDTVSTLIKKGEEWLVSYVAQKAAELTTTTSTEAAKTASLISAAEARSTAMLASAVGYDAATAASLATAEAAIMLANVLTDPIAGLATGAGQIGILQAIMGGAFAGNHALTAFASGGVIINEATSRPEIIAPYREFAEYSSQLIAQTVQATEQAVANRQVGRTGGPATGGGTITVNGKFTASGRTMQTVLDKNSVARQSEVISTSS